MFFEVCQMTEFGPKWSSWALLWPRFAQQLEGLGQSSANWPKLTRCWPSLANILPLWTGAWPTSAGIGRIGQNLAMFGSIHRCGRDLARMLAKIGRKTAQIGQFGIGHACPKLSRTWALRAAFERCLEIFGATSQDARPATLRQLSGSFVISWPKSASRGPPASRVGRR